MLLRSEEGLPESGWQNKVASVKRNGRKRPRVVTINLSRIKTVPNSPADSLDAHLIKALFQDVATAWLLIKDTDTQYNRRSLFRAFFAAVEGTIFMFRRIPLEAVQRRPRLFSHAELCILMEESAALQDNGKIAVQQKFQPTLASLRFLAVTLNRISKRFPTIEASQISWAAFQKCAQVRNRIVHPKKLSDVTITNVELHNLQVADTWFQAWASSVFEVEIHRLEIGNRRIEKRAALYRKIIQSLEKKFPRRKTNGD